MTQEVILDIVYFEYLRGQWTHKKNSILPSIPVPTNQGTNLSIDFKKHSEAFKVVGVWKTPQNSQKKQVDALIYKAKDCSRRIAISTIPRHLVWRILK